MKGSFRWFRPRVQQGERSRRYRFLGMNIKGTPAMSAKRVQHDLEVGKGKAHVLALQEFRWPWYWRVAKAVMAPRKALAGARWATSPGLAKGFAAPVRGAQAVMWVRSLFRRRRVWVRLLHEGRRRISESRFQRAVLLEARESGLAFIAWTTHAVVRGDDDHDPDERERILATDLANIDAMLGDLRQTGFPIIGQADLNIYRTSDAYERLDAILDKHGAKVYGHPGVEYLFVIQGTKVGVDVEGHFTVGTDALETDHEGRGLTFRLFLR